MKHFNVNVRQKPHSPFPVLVTSCENLSIGGLQSIPRESNDKDVAAMLVELTIEANEESFVIVLQHGGNDVTWKRSISIIYLNVVLHTEFNPEPQECSRTAEGETAAFPHPTGYITHHAVRTAKCKETYKKKQG